MIDGHIHIEYGPYTLSWIQEFVDQAVKMGLSEIRLLEHNYMFPEFACVGLNEEQIKEKGYGYKVGKFPMAANGRSVIMGDTGGWVKILADDRTGRILGVHILGARATDLIGEAAVAMQMHAKTEDLIHTIHAHPTVSEAIHEAALAVEHRAIHFTS